MSFLTQLLHLSSLGLTQGGRMQDGALPRGRIFGVTSQSLQTETWDMAIS